MIKIQDYLFGVSSMASPARVRSLGLGLVSETQTFNLVLGLVSELFNYYCCQMKKSPTATFCLSKFQALDYSTCCRLLIKWSLEWQLLQRSR